MIALLLSVMVVSVAGGCGGKKEEPQTEVQEEVTEAVAKETEEPEETVSPEKTDSGSEDSEEPEEKTAKKKKNKKKKKAQETTGAEETKEAEAAVQAQAQAQAAAQAQAQAEAQAKAEEEARLAAEQARIAEEERLAAEQAIVDQNIPQDTGGSTQEDPKTIAQSYVGRSMDELEAIIGQPQGENRMPGCLDGGDDVQYTYPGFYVITHELDGVRTVTGVE